MTLTIFFHQRSGFFQRIIPPTTGQLDQHGEVHTADHFNFWPEERKADICRGPSEKVGENQYPFALVDLFYGLAQLSCHLLNGLPGLKTKGFASRERAGYQFGNAQHFFSQLTVGNGDDADKLFLVFFSHQDSSLQMDIAMENARKILMFPKFLTDLVGQHHRPVLAAGTAKGDRHVTFSFLNIPGNQL
jgi:hypothetical protein